jgi:hypothetical protein
MPDVDVLPTLLEPAFLPKPAEESASDWGQAGFTALGPGLIY